MNYNLIKMRSFVTKTFSPGSLDVLNGNQSKVGLIGTSSLPGVKISLLHYPEGKSLHLIKFQLTSGERLGLSNNTDVNFNRHKVSRDLVQSILNFSIKVHIAFKIADNRVAPEMQSKRAASYSSSVIGSSSVHTRGTNSFKRYANACRIITAIS